MDSLRRSFRAAPWAAALLVLLSAAPASAGPYGLKMMGGELTCGDLYEWYCSPGSPCGDADCVVFGDPTFWYTACGDLRFSALCCDPGVDTDCRTQPSTGGEPVVGTCVPVARLVLPDGSAGGVCEFPAGARWCGPGATTARVQACLPAADTTAELLDWEAGDCDGDGEANGTDSEPCVAATPDAGTPDAGNTPRPDAGTGPPPSLDGTDVRGSGGCACRTAPGPHGALPAALAATLLALVVIRRRRG